MNVFLTGFYNVSGSQRMHLEATTLFGDLDSFTSAAAQAVEASKRDGSQSYEVWYHSHDSAEPAIRVGFAKRGQWCWR